MTPTLVILAALLVLGLLYWLVVRRWYERSEARRLDARRAMSGDAEILAPDFDATLAITADATPAAVWEALLNFGWPDKGRRAYEWFGRAFGFLEAREKVSPERSGNLERPLALAVGQQSQIRVNSIDPGRTLVLGREAGSTWWTWQFEITALDEGRARLILRDRARFPPTPGSTVALAVRRAVSFALTRKMLLDIKRSAEGSSQARPRPKARVA